MSVAHSALTSNSAPTDLIPIGEAAKLAGVCIQTMRNYVESGEIGCYRVGVCSHRRFSRKEILYYIGGQIEQDSKVRICVSYARCSTVAQKEALNRQIIRVRDYCKENYPEHELIEISDNASGMKFDRAGLVKLIQLIESGRLDNGVIVAEFRDRLNRAAVSLLEVICACRKIQIVYIEQDEERSDEQLLFDDVCSILHVFNCRNYAKRGSETQRKPLTVEAIEYGRQLYNCGATIQGITGALRDKGFRNEDGTEISKHSVRKYIQLQKALDRVQNRSSIDDWAELCEIEASPQTRSIIKETYLAYVQWCRKTGNGIRTQNVFTRRFNEKYKIGAIFKNGQNHRAYVGVKFKGVEYRVVKDYNLEGSQARREAKMYGATNLIG